VDVSAPFAAAVAVLAGVFIVVQATALGPLIRAVPPLVGALWVQVGGLVVVAVIVAVGPWSPTWPGTSLAAVAVLAGACTVGIVASIGAAVTPLGLATTLAVVTGVQLLLSLGLDATGLGGRTIPFDLWRLAGVVLIVGGVLLVFRGAGQGG
jgi:uncharacterized membrane protein YdcZ (DUF606 family)